MNQLSITFIGGGNMAGSLIGGLLADGYAPERLAVADADAGRRHQMEARFGVHTFAVNAEATAAADVVVIAVKPQIVETVAKELAPGLAGKERLVISVAAGIRTATLSGWLGTVPLVRTMPNTPALVQSGATVLYAVPGVGPGHRETAESIMRAVGLTQWVEDESLMDAVTALSGSGPAYFFLFMEMLEAEARTLGLEPEIARLLTIQTAFGAAKMALESPGHSPGELREQVTSPGGTTERALQVLREGELGDLIGRALRAARDRAVELSNLFDKGSA